jgi:sugar lactone lactonase YvrE
MAIMKKRLLSLAGVSAVTVAGLVTGVFGQGSEAQEPAGRTVRTVATFEDAGDVLGVPEGLTQDGEGGLYVTLFARNEVWHLDPGTGAKEKVADVPGGGVRGDLIGIERDPTDGTLLMAFKDSAGVNFFDPDHADCRDPSDTTTGVYRLDPASGEVTPAVTRGMGVPLCFPDDIAIGKDGEYYVTDLTLGVIWKFDRDGKGGVWSDHPLLGWTEQSATWNSRIGAPLGYLGANAVALSPDGKTLFVGGDGGPGGPTGAGLLIRIPINDDGSAGLPDLFASGLGLNDGLEVGPDGTIYFADMYNSDVWAFSADGTRRLLVASVNEFDDPLDNATSLVFMDGCLYNTQLGFFKQQQGKAAETLRSIVEICNFGDPAADGAYTPPPTLSTEPSTPLPPSARPTHPLFAYVPR